MAKAEIELDILADGRVRWKTGKIPGAHHSDADELQKELEAALGGEVQRTRRASKEPHVHHHDKVHQHIH